MAVFEIPLSPQPQKFQIPLNGVTYGMILRYIDTDMGGWVLDILESDDTPIIQGIPLVTGEDLLAQYAYLGIVGGLIVQTDHDVNAVPTYANLGVSSHLYFRTP